MVEFKNLNGEAPSFGRIKKINCSAGIYWDMDYPEYKKPGRVDIWKSTKWACGEDKKPLIY